MTYAATKGLISYCKNRVQDPDVIMDLFDKSFTWASNKTVKILGFSHEELANTRVLALRVKEKSDEEDLAEHIVNKDYVDDFPMKTKSGKIIIVKARVVTIEFRKNPYQIIKVMKLVEK